MPVTREAVLREAVDTLWRDPPPELVAAGLMPEHGLAGLTPLQLAQLLLVKKSVKWPVYEKSLSGVTVAQRLETVVFEEELGGKTVEQLLALVPIEQRLAGLTPAR